MIHIQSRDTLVDEDVTIVVGGVESGQKVTLRGSYHSDSNDLFESFAFYKSNEDGIVNVLKDRAMYGGSYEGVEPMGLFWSSQESTLNKKRFVRMIKKLVEKPLVMKIELFDDWKDLDEIRNIDPITSTQVNRWYISKGVTRVPVKVGKIRGTLFVPRGDGSFPGVIDMFGGAGGLFEFRASMLASRGFLALALAIYGYDDLPSHFSLTNLDYYEEAVQFLQNHPKSKKGGVGVVSSSFGSEIALCISTYVPGVTCAVCINGGNIVQFMPCRFRGYHIPAFMGNVFDVIYKDDVVTSKNWISFPNKSEGMKRHFPEYHKSNSSILFIGSELDGCYSMQQVHKLTENRLEKYGGGLGKYKFVLYPGAGHLLELPNNPLSTRVFVKTEGLYQYYGGIIKDHAKAQELSWIEILNFLSENIILQIKSKL